MPKIQKKSSIESEPTKDPNRNVPKTSSINQIFDRTTPGDKNVSNIERSVNTQSFVKRNGKKKAV